MAFKGMNPDDGRDVATGISEAGTRIQEVVGDMTSVVNSVEWVGPDYDAYTEDWNSFISGPLADLVNALAARSKTLQNHAEEQDDTSNQE